MAVECPFCQARTPCEHVVAVVVADVDARARTVHVDEGSPAARVLMEDDVIVRNALAERVACGVGDEDLPPRLAKLLKRATHRSPRQQRQLAGGGGPAVSEETVAGRMRRLLPGWRKAARKYGVAVVNDLPTQPQSFEMRDGCAAVYGSTLYQVTVHFAADVPATIERLREQLLADATTLRPKRGTVPLSQ